MIIVRYITSSFGFLSSIFAALHSKFLLSFVSFVASVTALLNSSVHANENDEYVQDVFFAIDSMMGVAVAIVCAFTTTMHTTCFGVARLLWIVTMVTSSSSYSYFAQLVDQDVLPNDISLIAISVSSGILIVSAIYMRCKTNKQNDDTDHILKRAVEGSLICGAFLLRFDNDIQEFTDLKIGVMAFHGCLWIAVVISSIIPSDNAGDHIGTLNDG
jgi:hypothetical protein